MKKAIFALLLVLALAFSATLQGCSFSKDNKVTLTGSIEGSSTNVSSELSAKVVEVKKAESDLVKAGELICKLDSKMLEIQKAQMEAQIKALQMQVKMAKDNSSQNTLVAIRYNIKAAEKSLAVIDNEIDAMENDSVQTTDPTSQIMSAINDKTKESNLIKLKLQREQTASQLDGLRLQLKNASLQGSNSIKLAQDNLEAARKSLDLVKENIKKCSVLSPISGMLTTINFKKGELVPIGAQLFTVMDTSYLTLKIYVPERLLSQIQLGASIEVTNPSFPDKKYTAKIIKIDEQGQFTPRNTETVDEKSNVVFGVKLQLNANGALKPGMIAEVTLDE